MNHEQFQGAGLMGLAFVLALMSLGQGWMSYRHFCLGRPSGPPGTVALNTFMTLPAFIIATLGTTVLAFHAGPLGAGIVLVGGAALTVAGGFLYPPARPWARTWGLMAAQGAGVIVAVLSPFWGSFALVAYLTRNVEDQTVWWFFPAMISPAYIGTGFWATVVLIVAWREGYFKKPASADESANPGAAASPAS